MDDESSIRGLSKIMLQRHEFEVEGAETAVEAIELIQAAQAENRPFKVAILDLSMPDGIGGVEILPKLRELDNGMKFIVSSGHSTSPQMENFADHGFDAAVSKPFRMDQLIGTVRRLCGDI